MAGSLNKACLIGNLGQDPDVKAFQSGDKYANFSLATSETYKNKAGERVDKTQWHKVTVKNKHLVELAEKYLRKGTKVYVEGQIETRKYEKDGKDVYTTEIVLGPYNGVITMLSGKNDDAEASHKGFTKQGDPSAPQPVETTSGLDAMNDEIPF